MSNGGYTKLLWDPVSGSRCEVRIDEAASTLDRLRFEVYDDEDRQRATFAVEIGGGKVQLVVDQFDRKESAEYHFKVPLYSADA